MSALLGNLSRDDYNNRVDALLRDVNTPGDVRAAVATDYAVARYLDSVEFYEDSDGVTHARPVPEPDPNAAPAAVETTNAPGTPAAGSEATLSPTGSPDVPGPLGETPAGGQTGTEVNTTGEQPPTGETAVEPNVAVPADADTNGQ